MHAMRFSIYIADGSKELQSPTLITGSTCLKAGVYASYTSMWKANLGVTGTTIIDVHRSKYHQCVHMSYCDSALWLEQYHDIVTLWSL